MYQYFVKIVPTTYRKLNGEVSTKFFEMFSYSKLSTTRFSGPFSLS